MRTTKHRVIALNLPNVVALVIVYGRHVVLAMTNNTWFPTPNPPLVNVAADLDALESSEVTARSGAKGTAAARDIRRKTVEDDLAALKAYVQSVVNQNPPDKAVAIIQSAGMSPKQFTLRQKLPLAALMGPLPGEVLVRAKAAGKRAAYEWQYSADGGKTWIAMGTTTVAETSVLGLVVGTTYLFRFRVTLKKVTGDWSQTISFTVH